jgi:hypothetical protein
MEVDWEISSLEHQTRGHGEMGTKRRAQGAELRAKGTEHRAKGTEHRAKGMEHGAWGMELDWEISSLEQQTRGYGEMETRGKGQLRMTNDALRLRSG